MSNKWTTEDTIEVVEVSLGFLGTLAQALADKFTQEELDHFFSMAGKDMPKGNLFELNKFLDLVKQKKGGKK